MKFVKEIFEELFDKKTLAWAGAALAFVMVSGFGFNALMSNSNAAVDPTINAWAYDESLNTDDAVPGPGFTGGGSDNTVVIREGEAIKLKWWPPSGSTSCSASGDWSGTKTHTGPTEQTVMSSASVGNFSYTITCSDSTGSASQTINVEVLGGSDDPAGVTIAAWAYEESLNGDDEVPNPGYTGGGSDNTVVIREGEDVKLKWFPQNVTSCTASGDWSGSKSPNTGATQNLGAKAPGTYGYTINCSNGSSSDSETINVEVLGSSGGAVDVVINAWAYDESLNNDDAVPGPGFTGGGSDNTVVIKQGEAIKLKWWPQNATTCSGSGNWSGSKSTTFGSEATVTTSAQPGNYTYNISCSNGSSSDSDTIKVQVLNNSGSSCNPRQDLEVIGNSGFTTTGIELINGETQARARVVNHSTNCTYSIGMASYQVHDKESSKFVLTQTLFDDQFQDIGPGQTKTFIVDVPACIFQVDVFEGPKVSPLPPDFNNLPNYNLLDWRIEQDGRVVCGPGQCPAGSEPNITSAASVSGKVGTPFSYTITATGLTPISYKVVSGTLPAGLTLSGNKITGTPTAPTTKTVTIEARNQCGVDLLNLTITITSDQCPAGFVAPNITSATSIPDKENGDSINYQIAFSQGSASSVNVSVSGLPSWLTFNSSTNRVTGTIPQNTTVNEEKFNVTVTGFSGSLACGADTIEVTITWEPGENQCPANFDAPVITGANSVSVNPGDAINYQFSVSGDGQINTNVLSLPSWLSYNPSNKTITGTVPLNFSGVEDFTISSIGTDLGSGKICGETTKLVTISVTVDEQCPDNFVAPTINGDSDVTVEVGEDVDYSFTVSGSGSKTVSVSGLPDWLTFNSSARTVTGIMRDETVTFTISVVARDGQGDVCGIDTLEVTLRPETDENQCPDLEPPEITSGDSFELKPGDGFNYLITFTGGGELDIDVSNLPSWLSFNENTNRVTGDMPDRNNYSFTVSLTQRDEDERLCGDVEKVVRISPKQKPTGRCINCENDDEPRVLVSSSRFTPPSGEVLGIALTEIPVTGVGGTLQSILFTIGLLIISAGLAYLIMSPKMRQRFLSIFSSGSSYRESLPVTAAEAYDSRYDGDELGGGYASSTAYSPTHPLSGGFGGVAAAAVDAQRQQRVEDRFQELSGRKNITKQEDDPFSERIAREIGALARRESKKDAIEPKAALGVDEVNTEKLAAKIEETAREYKVLISDDGVKTLIRSSNANENNALSILTELIKVSDEWYVREDGWLLLNQKRIKEVLFATYVMMVPTFLSWISEGDEERMFGFIKMLQSQGHSVKEFVKNAVYELDALYRYKTEGQDSEVSNETIKLAGRWNLSTIEKMIESFIGAIDGSYSNDFTPIKLALLRAVSIAGEENRE